MLTDTEKIKYAECINSLRVAAQSKGKVKADECMEKACQLKSIIFPVSMMINLTRSLYYRGQELVDMISGEDIKRAGRAQNAWRMFFIEAAKKYNCTEIEWNTFPKIPKEYPWLLKFPFK